ncbi:MAG: sulfurtransferase-like selenium metabolism protein YedF [Thermodesulfobacteriaceae bacterium]|nr:sulfurtransferase-like selenium metabolism protein YedF [Thermodesulfobacteriaceae bacterium]MDW8135212.1 sulfurtransferase-like selenium metabolism protein YedF [Thermodesulfobacterium sp.]
MKELDLRGLPCPQPVIKTAEALNEIKEGERLKILVDSEVSFQNVQKFLNSQGHKVLKIEESGKNYLLEIEKTVNLSSPFTTCEISSEEKKKLLLIIANDTLGKEEIIGRTLMKGFFESMLAHNLIPDRIFFMNRGVKLTTEEEELILLIKELEKRGVEIFTCGTCLKYFNLEDKLQVGKRGGTDLYLEGIFQFKKTIWIS